MNTCENRFAIVGMACQFPKAHNIYDYWRLLVNGGDGISSVPETRWNWREYYCEDERRKGMITSKWGGFIDNIEGFDAPFFGFSSREAERVDPQQRLVLETAWHALEHAGMIPKTLSGSNTGVYMGISHSDHGRKLNSQRYDIDENVGPDHYLCFAANRLSYFLNLKGPSFSIDAACASTVVALNQAVQALCLHEIDIAIIGGVNAHLMAEESIYCSLAGFLSSDGRCYSFDERAQGFSRSEGCGIIVLRRLKDAIKDNQNIHAIIESVAIGHNGLTNKITSPSSTEQQAVIKRAIAKTNIKPNEISYVEAHGTGSQKGDACEYHAISTVLKQDRNPKQLCYIGSVKTNIGHLEAASGVAAIIKTVLCLKNKMLVANRDFKSKNELIDKQESPFKFIQKNRPWSIYGNRLYAAINTYSFSGVNGSVILSDTSAQELQAKDTVLPRLSKELDSYFITLSAASFNSLLLNMKSFSHWLNGCDENIDNIAYTTNMCRQHLKYRFVVIIKSKKELVEWFSTNFKDDFLINNDYSQAFYSKKEIITRKLLVYISCRSICFLVSLLRREKRFFSFALKNYEKVFYKKKYQVKSFIELKIDDKKGLSTLEKYFLLFVFIEYLKSLGIDMHSISGDGIGEIVALTQVGLVSFSQIFKCLEDSKKDFKSIRNYTFFLKEMLANRNSSTENICFRYEPIKSIVIHSNNVNRKLIEEHAKRCSVSLSCTQGLQCSLIEVGDWFDFHESNYSLIFKNHERFSGVVSITNKHRCSGDQILAQLYANGVSIKWSNLYKEKQYKIAELPCYEFDKSYHWYNVQA